MTTAAPQILLIDDDERLLNALSLALSARGFTVESATDAGEAIKAIERQPPDVVVLDVMMPVLSGLQLCEIIQNKIDAPVLMLTALDSVQDRLAGFNAGADDYLAKPFATDELEARLRALLRRAQPRPHKTASSQYADLVLDARVWKVERGGRPVELTSREFRILEILMSEPVRVFSREEILAAAWGDTRAVESNAVDVHMASLRQKLEEGGASRLIQTIRGVGYSLRE